MVCTFFDVTEKFDKQKLIGRSFDNSKIKHIFHIKMAFSWPNLATAVALAIILVLPLSSGLYFHIGETERKCFIEEIPDETMVTGNFKLCVVCPKMFS